MENNQNQPNSSNNPLVQHPANIQATGNSANQHSESKAELASRIYPSSGEKNFTIEPNGAENLQEKYSVQPELANQQLANKIYPAGKTSTVGEYAGNITNDTQTPVDSDADVAREGVKKGLGLARVYKNAPPKAAAVSRPRPKKSTALVRVFLVLLVIGVGTSIGYFGWGIVALIVCSLPNSNCK